MPEIIAVQAKLPPASEREGSAAVSLRSGRSALDSFTQRRGERREKVAHRAKEKRREYLTLNAMFIVKK